MIKLASPDIRDEDILAATEVLASGDLVQGKNVAAFETALAQFTGLQHSIVMSSGTASLHLALLALGIGPGDVVIVSAFTFPATANVVEQVGAKIVLCDVEADTYVISPDELESCIQAHSHLNLKAVLAVPEFGQPLKSKAIRAICDRYKLFFIEDSACALGTIEDGHHTGYYSHLATFSFHPRKAITTGEGGAILTQSAELANKIRCFLNHGMVRSNEGMLFQEAGLNYRLTDFQAALALGQLSRFPDELGKRQLLAEKYNLCLHGTQSELQLPVILPGHSLQSYMVVLPEKYDRSCVIQALANHKIQSNLGAQSIACLDYYQRKYGFTPKSAPQASHLYKQGLVLPLYGKLLPSQIETVSSALISILQMSPVVS